MEQNRREKAELLVRKVLEEKSFESLSEGDKSFLIDEYSDEMKIESKNYDDYLALSVQQKLVNIIIYSLKEYLGSWHVSTQEMNEISEYLKTISKIK